MGITASDGGDHKVLVLVAHTVDVLDPDNDLVPGTDGPPGSDIGAGGGRDLPRPATSCNVLSLLRERSIERDSACTLLEQRVEGCLHP